LKKPAARRGPAFVALSFLAISTCVLAGEESAPDFAQETLSGDWSGARSAAAKRGLLFDGGIRVDALRNRGALNDGSKTVSHIDLKLRMDLDKAAGWPGGSAMINVISDAGQGPNARLVGSLMGVTNIEVGDPTTTRLFQAWLQQDFLDGRLALLAGLYPIDSEFFTLDSASVFLGPQYGTPADLALTNTPSIFNNSAFGIRARWTIAPALYAMGAVLDGVPNDPAHPKRTSIRFARDDGGFTIGELGWLPEEGNHKFKGHAKLAAGIWGYSRQRPDQLDVANIDAGNIAAPARSRRSWGGYLLGERTLLRMGHGDDRYISGFARYTFADGDSTAIKNTANLGMYVRGAFAARPDDIAGIAVTRARLSGSWRSAQAVGGTATTNNEDALEVTWRYSVTPWFAIQPNYQYIRNPGGVSGKPDARLIGARLELAL
jgi:porin